MGGSSVPSGQFGHSGQFGAQPYQPAGPQAGYAGGGMGGTGHPGQSGGFAAGAWPGQTGGNPLMPELANPLEKAEYEALLSALRANGGHRERTAEALGVSRRTLQYKLKKFGLTRQYNFG